MSGYFDLSIGVGRRDDEADGLQKQPGIAKNEQALDREEDEAAFLMSEKPLMECLRRELLVYGSPVAGSYHGNDSKEGEGGGLQLALCRNKQADRKEGKHQIGGPGFL